MPWGVTQALRLETSAMATRSRLKVREGKNMAGAQWAGRNRGGLLRRAPYSVLEHEIEMHGEADGTNTPTGHEAEQECLWVKYECAASRQQTNAQASEHKLETSELAHGQSPYKRLQEGGQSTFSCFGK